MPHYSKLFLYICTEIFIVLLGGVVGAWLSVRDVPMGEGTPGDGIGMVLFGGLGMIVAGMVGIVLLVIFWSVMALRHERAEDKSRGDLSVVPQADGVWPPAPKR